MDPSDTVNSFSISSPTPTPNPHSSSSAASTGMSGQDTNSIAGLISQFKLLMAMTAEMEQQIAQFAPEAFMETENDGPVPANLSSSAAHAEQAPVVSPVVTSTVQPSTPVVQLKVAVPDTFNGNSAKAQEFLNSVNLYFFGRRGLTDEQKVTFALSYMKGGTAGPWANRMLKLYVKGSNPTWDNFLSEFRAAFMDIDPKGTAQHKLSMLKQGNNIAEVFVASFKELMDESCFGEQALIHFFERGLSETLVTTIYSVKPHPSTLTEWMEAALLFDKLSRQLHDRHRGIAAKHTASSSIAKLPSSHHHPFKKQSDPPKPPAAVPSSSSDVVPMEVDSSKKSFNPKRCYKCHKVGHFARDCKSVDISAMDYDEIKAFFRREIQKEDAATVKETQDFQ